MADYYCRIDGEASSSDLSKSPANPLAPIASECIDIASLVSEKNKISEDDNVIVFFNGLKKEISFYELSHRKTTIAGRLKSVFITIAFKTANPATRRAQILDIFSKPSAKLASIEKEQIELKAK